MTQALEKTGDVISKAATNAGKTARNKPGDGPQEDALEQQHEGETPTWYEQPTIAAIPDKRQEILSSFTQGLSHMLETTKQSMKEAEQKVEASWKQAEEKVKARLSMARTAYYKRDPSLPLDVEALKDAEVVYITDRIITMGHPACESCCLSLLCCSLNISDVGRRCRLSSDVIFAPNVNICSGFTS